jgi:hypothetical protein
LQGDRWDDDLPEKNSQKPKRGEAEPMRETCAVDLRVRLPASVAAEIEEVQRDDPEMLSQMLVYAVARRLFFHELATRAAGPVRLDGHTPAEVG